MRRLADVKASVRLDVVLARDRTPQSHLFADEFPKLFRAVQRERHLLCLIELLGNARLAQGRESSSANLPTIALGVPVGAKTPHQAYASNPG